MANSIAYYQCRPIEPLTVSLPSAVLLFVFATTTFTLLRVALFASWSLLSNVTVYIVLLFHPAYSRGNYLRVIDADNYVEDHMAGLSLFGMELVKIEGERIVYPNHLRLGSVATVETKARFCGVGKIVNLPEATSSDSQSI